VAERHIPKCATIINKPKPPPGMQMPPQQTYGQSGTSQYKKPTVESSSYGTASKPKNTANSGGYDQPPSQYQQPKPVAKKPVSNNTFGSGDRF